MYDSIKESTKYVYIVLYCI